MNYANYSNERFKKSLLRRGMSTLRLLGKKSANLGKDWLDLDDNFKNASDALLELRYCLENNMENKIKVAERDPDNLPDAFIDEVEKRAKVLRETKYCKLYDCLGVRILRVVDDYGKFVFYIFQPAN